MCCKDNNKTCYENCKICCKKIKIKRYFLPLVFAPAALIYENFQNYIYVPLFLFLSAFILFWNFPKIVYYTASKPIYFKDLFVDDRKLPNYDVNPKLKRKFELIIVWVLIVTNSLLVAALGDYWLYRTLDTSTTVEIIGVTGGIIKIFQILNSNISMIMLKILKHFIKKENKRLRQLEIEKMRELVKYNFKLNLTNNKNRKINENINNKNEKIELQEKDVEMKEFKPQRDRIQTI